MVRTAGMVRGTLDWQLDRMYETETEEILEKQYREDDFPGSVVASDIDTAAYHIGQAVSFLCRAYSLADRYGKGGPIDELIGRLEDFRCDMEAERDRMEGRK